MYAQREKLEYQYGSLLLLYKVQPGSYFLHWHNEFEIVYVTKGTMPYRVNQYPLTLMAGDVLFINSGDVHEMDATPLPGEAYILVVNAETFPRELPRGELHSFYLVGKNNAESYQFSQVIDRLAAEYTNEYGYRDEALLSLLHLLYICLLRMAASGDYLAFAESPPKESELCKAILNFFETVPPCDYHLDAISKQLSYTPNYLCKIFKSIFHKSFYQYALAKKLDTAQKLLVKTVFGIEEIALQSGFTSSRALHAAFRKQFHTSPSAYRNSRGDRKQMD